MKLKAGYRRVKCRRMELSASECFRTDAKAAGDTVAIGGWETSVTKDPKEARWFSIVLNQDNTPWLKCKGEPFQVIASLELLSSLYAVMAFWPEGKANDGAITLTGAGITENLGNACVVSKLMTTKFPLCAILMELSEQLDCRSSWLRLLWSPRDQNQEADALTNSDFHQFSAANRIHLDPASMKWFVLEEMLEAGGSMTEELVRLRAEKKALRDRMREVKRKKKKQLASQTLRARDPWQLLFVRLRSFCRLSPRWLWASPLCFGIEHGSALLIRGLGFAPGR